ncbi:MAG: hypothetical protein C0483_05275 [Pirellula sp.]|nr:hypothetical protein [Pirellula sp.]
MTNPNIDDAWRRLTTAARDNPSAEVPLAPPEGLADRVLLAVRNRSPMRRSDVTNERILGWSAALALAASLLLAVSSWQDLSSLLSPRPSPFDGLVTWELLP